MSISEDANDLCLEIDALDEEIRFVCRSCKKENSLKLVNNKKIDPYPKIGLSRF